MRAFLASLIAVIVIGLGAMAVLDYVARSSADAYRTENVRL